MERKIRTYFNHIFREISQLRNVNTKALVRNARFDPIQKRNALFGTSIIHVFIIIIAFPMFGFGGDVSDDMQILHMFDLLVQIGQLVEVGCEEAEGVDLRGDMPRRDMRSV